tara:strand:+ start:757 stop:1332 length:576 start_codon:yes stop_codon:yes gene_type:complete
MDKIYQNYETRLDNILNTLRNSNENTDIEENKDIEEYKDDLEQLEETNDKKGPDRLKCKQFDTINYCYEMYKVRKNKKADFDIYSTQKYNIEDENIDKMEIVLGWKELDNNKKEELIEDYIDTLSNTYISLSKTYIKDFVIKNKAKIRYNKKDKKIDTILGICYLNNELSIKKKKQKSNLAIDKLRKTIKK